MGQWSSGSEDQGVISNNPAVNIRNKNCFVSTVTVSNIIGDGIILFKNGSHLNPQSTFEL